MHTSTNESMNSLCKPLNIDLVPDKSQKRDDILCIYFDLSTTKFHAERCDNNNKSFFCYNFKNGKNILSPSLFFWWPATDKSVLGIIIEKNKRYIKLMRTVLTGYNHCLKFYSYNDTRIV